MALIQLVAVHCKLYAGIFPSERFFEVELANGETHRGIAPRHFCWNKSGSIVGEEETTDDVEGLVAGKLLSYENLPAGVFAVEVPDGEVLAVKADGVQRRPTQIIPRYLQCKSSSFVHR